MSSWNIILCGYLPNTIVVSVTDPAKWTVDNLKQLVIKDVPKATKSDITFYASNNKQLPEGVPLKECAVVRNGTGLLTIIKPFVIKVYSPDVDVTATVEIPLLEFDDWVLNNLIEAIHFKLALDKYAVFGGDLLVFNGKLLGNDPKVKVSSIPDISNGCLMTYTRFHKRHLQTPQNSKIQVIIPKTVDLDFALDYGFYQRNLDHSESQNWLDGWKIVVQQLDGSKTTLALRDPHEMSVIDLKDYVEEKLPIPPHQQKLLLSDDVVLEDWKRTPTERYRETFITDYPSFCDGAKLYIVQLTGGIRVNIKIISSLVLSIPNPKEWTVTKLINVIKARFDLHSVCHFIFLDKHILSPSDELISSVDGIIDNCTLRVVRQK